MSLFDALNKVINVTEHGVRPSRPGEAFDNTAALNAIIGRGGDNGLRVEPAGFDPYFVAPQHRGTLYFPAGRYLFDVDPAITTNWSVNLAALIDRSGQLNNAGQVIQSERLRRPFGDSVRFPEGTTLWLAPGAVLVPARGCVVDISSLLVCEDVQCFDLSREGLVVFGRGVPVLRPEWWGVLPGVDASNSIQRAVDAAIHDRSIAYPNAHFVAAPTPHWEAGERVIQRPSLIVELRGEYTVGRTIDVRGDATRNGLWLQRRLPDDTSMTLPSGATTKAPDGATVIRGAWSGGRRRGASLLGHGILDAPLLRLTHCSGITVQDLTFVSPRTDYQPGIELRTSSLDQFTPGVLLPATQCIALARCRFEGAARPLVQVGARVTILPANPPSIDTPSIRPGNDFGSDFSLLSFEDCEFQVHSAGVGLEVRANQSLPIRYRRCDFSGDAVAFMSLWNSTHYLEGCRFANLRRPASPAAAPVDVRGGGLELPDASDIFLRAEYPWRLSESDARALDDIRAFPRDPTVRLAGEVLIRTEQDLVPGLVVVGCVSRSPQFLATVSPGRGSGMQAAEWPTLLINMRHRAVGTAVGPSVRWGLTCRISSASHGDRSRRDMNRGGPFVVIGGFYSQSIFVHRGACQGAVIGLRTEGVPGVQMGSVDYPEVAWPSTTVFGLRADQRRPEGSV